MSITHRTLEFGAAALALLPGWHSDRAAAKKKLLLASVAALSVLSTSVAYAADESDPPLPRFRPWQQVWQCNDIRVTVTARDPISVEYDLGGTIWGGSRFTVVKGELFFNGRPCLPLQPTGYW